MLQPLAGDKYQALDFAWMMALTPCVLLRHPALDRATSTPPVQPASVLDSMYRSIAASSRVSASSRACRIGWWCSGVFLSSRRFFSMKKMMSSRSRTDHLFGGDELLGQPGLRRVESIAHPIGASQSLKV